MEIKFDSRIQYQLDAISSVVEVFHGQPLARAGGASILQIGGLLQTEHGIANQLVLGLEDVYSNMRQVQEKFGLRIPGQNIAEDECSRGGGKALEFSISMETGTGKTYVYLRTILELNKTYGFKKFVVVVPSVAVREGVLKHMEVLSSHFDLLYGRAPKYHFVYDSKHLGRVRQFAASDQLHVMIINIQSFRRFVNLDELPTMSDADYNRANVINRDSEQLSGLRPIDYISSTRPIVIIDEPQSVDNTPGSRAAIQNLNSLATFRYSATHLKPVNLLYKIDPVRAYEMRLVKRIEVASITTGAEESGAYIRLLETEYTSGIRARVEILKQAAHRTKLGRVWVKVGDDLFRKSNSVLAYRSGYIVQNIDCTPGHERIVFNQGEQVSLGAAVGGNRDEAMRAQVYETVEQHMRKERMLQGKGIKVLTLFFIDRVSNYRVYEEDGSATLGKIGKWFEDAYREIIQRPAYSELRLPNVESVHGGYFSLDRKDRPKDTTGNTSDDTSTYSIIMREKERLLDPREPLRFIFSHSALREGWDNPNVFQICTLNETLSPLKKRQEIGRGLRLPVNQDGERIHDDSINRLTIVANESYEEFARTLQVELENDVGVRFGVVEKFAFSKLVRRDSNGQEREIGPDVSRRIWEELVANGYLNRNGEILDKFSAGDLLFSLIISEEFEDLEAGIIDIVRRKMISTHVANAREKQSVKFQKHVHVSDEFKDLWNRIKQKTRYRVTFETNDLIHRAVERIKNMGDLESPRGVTNVVGLDLTEGGVSVSEHISSSLRKAGIAKVLPDILSFLQTETDLTRKTLATILRESGRVEGFILNPQEFMTRVAHEISAVMQDMMLSGIRYEKMPGLCWEQDRIRLEAEKGVVSYLCNLYMLRHPDKSLFDAIEFESETERRFAQHLDTRADVKLFVKLPRWFKIDTPIGPYNPDWAFVTEGDEKLYFVRETKGTLEADDLRIRESHKIKCGRQHFKTLGVDYGVVAPPNFTISG